MLVFDDEVEVRLWVERVGSSSITYRWEVTKDGETAIDGTHTVVRVGSDGRPRPVWGRGACVAGRLTETALSESTAFGPNVRR